MIESIYVVERENDGEIWAFHTMDDARMFILKEYVESELKVFRQNILENLDDPGHISEYLDFLTSDLKNLHDDGYIDGFMFIREATLI